MTGKEREFTEIKLIRMSKIAFINNGDEPFFVLQGVVGNVSIASGKTFLSVYD
jgi:hypothetical protein